VKERSSEKTEVGAAQVRRIGKEEGRTTEPGRATPNKEDKNYSKIRSKKQGGYRS